MGQAQLSDIEHVQNLQDWEHHTPGDIEHVQSWQGWEPGDIEHVHFPERFFGTARRGLTIKVGKGGDENGPALWRIVHSLAKYSVTMWGQASADWRLGACLVVCGPV